MAATRAEELLEMLQELDAGRGMVEFHSHLRAVVDAVRTTGKAGKITLSLGVSPKGDRKITVVCDVKATVPQADKEKTLFFVGEDGQLTRHDPDQPELPLLRRIVTQE